MPHRWVLLAFIACAAVVSSCGSSSTDSASPAQVGSIGDAVEVAVEGLAGADAAACDLDHRTLVDASEMYLALNGSLPATQDVLVEARILTEPSARFEITTDGAIVPSPGSPCV